MNVTELARRVKVSPNELLQILPVFGFDIGRRAIKVDDRTAWKIIEGWPRIRREWQKIREKEEKKSRDEADLEGALREKHLVELPQFITVREFSQRLGLPVARLISELMKNGILATMNERLDFTTASILAQDLGFKVKEEITATKETTKVVESADLIRDRISKEEPTALTARPPVVVVMGHVDHGKTKLLDAIRKTNVMEGEAGGITQHIGAYQTVRHERNITFIDTPGHEAFTTMRSRGARIADVAILVVAADDGVQPQTVEALNIIQAAKIPFVVAINKMDKPDAQADKVKRELSEKGILPEDWGGKIPFVPISAKTGLGLDALLDVILLTADLEKEKIVANPKARALGTIIESHLDPGEGAVATLLVQNGTLKTGDYLAVGNDLYGKVRAMREWNATVVNAAPPGMPVKILGFKVSPEVGDIVEVPVDPKKLETKKVVPTYKEGAKSNKIAESIEAEKAAQTLINVIVRTDVLGSLEAISNKLGELQTPEVAVKVVVSGLGNINESDILQAEAAHAVVYGFHVLASPQVLDLAREKNIEIQIYKIIYELLDDVKGRLEVLLKPEIIHTALGNLKVLAVFRQEKQYAIIGGRVEEGKAVKGAKVKIMRAGEEVGEGTIAELQQAKQPVATVPGGSECGLKVNSKVEIEEGDVLNIYKEEKKERKLVL
ncbi:translation initiation factor IF-2 [Candidatus Uhrbacteria bacterium]|nr:translation initiation factor IF-2 [Candidatus Uhrbacteria bacterium]